jgi:hypothetical protein
MAIYRHFQVMTFHKSCAKLLCKRQKVLSQCDLTQAGEVCVCMGAFFFFPFCKKIFAI